MSYDAWKCHDMAAERRELIDEARSAFVARATEAGGEFDPALPEFVEQALINIDLQIVCQAIRSGKHASIGMQLADLSHSHAHAAAVAAAERRIL